MDVNEEKIYDRAVIRDHFGRIIAPTAASICNPGSVLAGELSHNAGSLLCKHCGISHIWVFSDSLEAIHVVNDSKELLSP